MPAPPHIAFCSSTDGGATFSSTSFSSCSANIAAIFLFSSTLTVTKPINAITTKIATKITIIFNQSIPSEPESAEITVTKISASVVNPSSF